MKTFFRNPRVRRWLTVAGALLLTFLLFDGVVMPWYVDHGSTREVPSVVGLPYEEARVILDSAFLLPVQSEIRSDPKIPIGNVSDQNPPAGVRVKEGRRVYLSISGGEVLVSVPRLRGLSGRDARFALERVGLHLGGITYAPSDTYFENTIMEQEVPPGTKVRKGASVGITVSEGKLLDEQTVPDLAGRTLSEAEALLRTLHLQVGRVTYQSGLDLIPNTVVDQFPRAGESIAAGGSIDLFVAKLSGDKNRTKQEEH